MKALEWTKVSHCSLLSEKQNGDFKFPKCRKYYLAQHRACRRHLR